jgi:hypothetical protein
MTLSLATLLMTVLLQDPAEPAVTLAREVRRHHATASDSEVRLRLAEVVRKMSDRANLSLCGEPQDPEHQTLRTYDLRTLLWRTKDSYSMDFWHWIRPDGTSEFTNDEAREPMIGEEQIADLIKTTTGPDRWQGETLIDKAANGNFWITAPPDLHRKVARVIQNLNRESLAGVRISVTLLASPKPFATGAGPDGVISEEAWDRLCKQAEEGAIRRLGSIETVAQQEQVVSGFSGVRRSVAMTVGESGPVASMIPDGLAMEASALGSGDRFSLRLRLAFTKVLAVDELATAKGTLRLPRMAEAGFNDLRSVPAGVPVVLGTMGPFPAEADVPPQVILVARLSWVRP